MTPTIKSCIPKNREEWLALRRNYITATDLVAIRGEVNWDDPLSTLRRKLGLEPEKAPNARMTVGNILEKALRAYAMEAYGSTIKAWKNQGEVFYYDEANHLASTPDSIYTNEVDQDELLELKTGGTPWLTLPKRVVTQVHAQAATSLPHVAAPAYRILHCYVTDEEAEEIVCRAALGEVVKLPREPEHFRNPCSPELIQELRDQARTWYEEHVLLGMPLPCQLGHEPTKGPEGRKDPEAVMAFRSAKQAVDALDKDLKSAKEVLEEAKKTVRERLKGDTGLLLGDDWNLDVGWTKGRKTTNHEALLLHMVEKHGLQEEMKELLPNFTTIGAGYPRFKTIKAETAAE